MSDPEELAREDKPLESVIKNHSNFQFPDDVTRVPVKYNGAPDHDLILRTYNEGEDKGLEAIIRKNKTVTDPTTKVRLQNETRSSILGFLKKYEFADNSTIMDEGDSISVRIRRGDKEAIFLNKPKEVANLTIDLNGNPTIRINSQGYETAVHTLLHLMGAVKDNKRNELAGFPLTMRVHDLVDDAGHWISSKVSRIPGSGGYNDLHPQFTDKEKFLEYMEEELAKDKYDIVMEDCSDQGISKDNIIKTIRSRLEDLGSDIRVRISPKEDYKGELAKKYDIAFSVRTKRGEEVVYQPQSITIKDPDNDKGTINNYSGLGEIINAASNKGVSFVEVDNVQHGDHRYRMRVSRSDERGVIDLIPEKYISRKLDEEMEDKLDIEVKKVSEEKSRKDGYRTISYESSRGKGEIKVKLDATPTIIYDHPSGIDAAAELVESMGFSFNKESDVNIRFIPFYRTANRIAGMLGR